MQSPACLAAHGGDTTGTFDAKCIGRRRRMHLTSPSMEAHAAGRPRLLVCARRGPAAVRAPGWLSGFASGRRAVYVGFTAGVS